MHKNVSAIEELAATAEEMSGQAEELQALLTYFKLNSTQASHVLAKATTKKTVSKPVINKADP